MADSTHDTDPRLLPVTYSPRQAPDIEHQHSEWASGSRGGGKVPKSFSWQSNPKQHQEENGAGAMTKPISR